jgi:hypothetical protein
MTVTAIITYTDPIDQHELIELSTGHELQYGGSAGDGYCYTHQSFTCMANLTPEEEAAVQTASESPL